MDYVYLKKKRINKLNLPRNFNINKLQIGIPVKNDEAKKVNLKNVGDIVLPSAKFGNTSHKNAYGYFYADYEQPKERRCVSTNWIQPYGNDDASSIAVDIYRECYPRVYVPSFGIEFVLYEENEQQYILANLTDRIRKEFLKETINLFLEIFGYCYIFKNGLEIKDENKRRRCNWEILPPGEKPSIHLKNQLKKSNEKTDTFYMDRLDTIEQYEAEMIVEGINGFSGYYAYVFENICILESAKYGNATYFIPKENWEILSQKTKQELLDDNKVVKKLIHNQKWKKEFSNEISNYSIVGI